VAFDAAGLKNLPTPRSALCSLTGTTFTKYFKAGFQNLRLGKLPGSHFYDSSIAQAGNVEFAFSWQPVSRLKPAEERIKKQ